MFKKGEIYKNTRPIDMFCMNEKPIKHFASGEMFLYLGTVYINLHAKKCFLYKNVFVHTYMAQFVMEEIFKLVKND